MKFSKMFASLGLAVTLAISSVSVSFQPKKVQAQSASQRPYVVFVNGHGDCCAWSMNDVEKALQNMGADDIRYVPWDSFRDGARQRSATSNDRQFLTEAEDFINNQLDPNRPLILIGHSFGGDSLLSLAPRIKRRILFLGVIDPVAAGGLREPIRGRGVPSTVDYFFNRWQTNAPWPVDLQSGSVRNCNATTCDQQEQNKSRRANGSHIDVECDSWEVTCPGYEPWPGGSNGTKQKRMHHQSMPYDDYIERQIIDRLTQLLEVARGRQFYFQNNCSKPIQLALGYRNPSDRWETNGWWSFEPNEGSYLAHNGERIRSNNSTFYYYAEVTASGYDASWSGDESREFSGRTLPMKKTELSPDSDGDYTLSLSCTNLE
ncbi:MAG: DUF1036 domain-containing protein [Cyanobacteriota bacterium]|nr:DUF1036 domain-containing protein [Cyanobacteriota bacterium]